MKSIIDDQTVRFDSHDAGSGQPQRWGDGVVHMDKHFGEGRRRRIRIKIPIDSNQQIDFGDRNADDVEIRKIVNELKKALRPGNKRKELIGKIVKTIDSWSNGDVPEETVRIAGRQIAETFGLKPDFEEEVVTRARDRNLISYMGIHYDIAERRLYRITQGHGSVSVGSIKRGIRARFKD